MRSRRNGITISGEFRMALSTLASRWIPYTTVVFIALAATLPFLNKAYHIDDVLYLTVARQIIQSPLNPYGDPVSTVVMWDAENGQPASLFNTDYNPPLWKYILAATIKFWGTEEWKPHLVVAVVVLLASIGLYEVSRRLTAWPLWCVAMILWAPYFLPGQNCHARTDGALPGRVGDVFSVSLVGDGKTSAGIDSGDTSRAGGAHQIFDGCSPSSFVIGCFLFQGPPTETRRGLLFVRLTDLPRSLVFIIPAALLLGFWCAYNIAYYGRPHLTSHGVVFHPGEWFGKTLTVLRTVGAVSLFGPIWSGESLEAWHPGSAALVFIALVSALTAWADVNHVGRFYGYGMLLVLNAQLTLFTGLGTATLLAVAASSYLDLQLDRRIWWSASTDRLLEWWIAAYLVFNVACTPFNAVRHMLLVFVPMTWLTARRMPLSWSRFPLTILGLSTALGFLLAASDYELANLYRDIAQRNIRRNVAAGRKVWVTGN